jgi:hypothetical protein
MSMIDVTFVQELFSVDSLGGLKSTEIVIEEMKMTGDVVPKFGAIVTFGPPDDSVGYPEWLVVSRSDVSRPFGAGAILYNYYRARNDDSDDDLVYACVKVYVDRLELRG